MGIKWIILKACLSKVNSTRLRQLTERQLGYKSNFSFRFTNVRRL